MGKSLRIALLLLLLFFVAADQWLRQQRSVDWDIPIWVALYPINGDGSEASRRYIAALTEAQFEPLQRFFEREAARHGLTLTTPFIFKLADEVESRPPQPPRNGSTLEVMLWSLKMRWWSWRNESYDGPTSMSLFLLYHEGEEGVPLAHSVGLQKGHTGIVNAFADRRERGGNQVIIAHELLHLIGASDKYSMGDNRPLHPHGYAEPDRLPLYPQRFAELMGGRIPISAERAEIPRRLARVVVGEMTAAEIRWR